MYFSIFISPIWLVGLGTIQVKGSEYAPAVGQDDYRSKGGACATILYTVWLFFLCFSLAGVQFVCTCFATNAHK